MEIHHYSWYWCGAGRGASAYQRINFTASNDLGRLERWGLGLVWGTVPQRGGGGGPAWRRCRQVSVCLLNLTQVGKAGIAWLELVYGNDDDCSLCSRKFSGWWTCISLRSDLGKLAPWWDQPPGEIQPYCTGAVVVCQSRCSTAAGAVHISRDTWQNHLWLCLLNAFVV